MFVSPLVVATEATHQSLDQRLTEARDLRASRSRPRERFARTDAFMAATSRHLAAVEDVLLPVVAHGLPDGHVRVESYLHEARLLEQSLALLKARLYGEQHASHLSWAQVWEEAETALRRHNECERSTVAELDNGLDETSAAALAERIYRAELRAPTRAHPFIPHTGRLGHLARRLWAVADRFWDMVEGRAVPTLVAPPSREHRHDSLMGQYLVGEPHFDADAPLFAPRRHVSGQHARHRR